MNNIHTYAYYIYIILVHMLKDTPMSLYTFRMQLIW
jgi:hypothetical protein